MNESNQAPSFRGQVDMFRTVKTERPMCRELGPPISAAEDSR